MTSKEALECLTMEATTDFQKGVHSKSNCFKWRKIIKNDLEVLKALKKYLVIATNSNDDSQCLLFDRYIYNDDIDTEADFYLIKEWLENEEIN